MSNKDGIIENQYDLQADVLSFLSESENALNLRIDTLNKKIEAAEEEIEDRKQALLNLKKKTKKLKNGNIFFVQLESLDEKRIRIEDYISSDWIDWCFENNISYRLVYDKIRTVDEYGHEKRNIARYLYLEFNDKESAAAFKLRFAK